MFKKRIRKSIVSKKLEVSVTCGENDLEIRDCKTLLGLFSLGEIEINIPLRSISSCVIKNKINWKRSLSLVILPFLLQAIIYTSTASNAFAPICLLLMALGILSIFLKDTYLRISDNGGNRYDINICFNNKDEARDLIKEINKNLAQA